MGHEAASLLRSIGAPARQAHQPLTERPPLVVLQHPLAQPVRLRRRHRLRHRDHLAHPGERAVHRHVLLLRDQSAYYAVFLSGACRGLERAGLRWVVGEDGREEGHGREGRGGVGCLQGKGCNQVLRRYRPYVVQLLSILFCWHPLLHPNLTISPFSLLMSSSKRQKEPPPPGMKELTIPSPKTRPRHHAASPSPTSPSNPTQTTNPNKSPTSPTARPSATGQGNRSRTRR